MVSFPVTDSNIGEPALFRVRHNTKELNSGDLVILPVDNSASRPKGCAFLLTNQTLPLQNPDFCLYLRVEALPPLDDGDIVMFSPIERACHVLYSAKSLNNVLFLTQLCNSRCITCPQPPAADPINFFDIAMQIVQKVFIPPANITITGGEPTLLKDRLVLLLQLISEKWPETMCTLLTNGRLLSDYAYTSQLISASNNRLDFGIPVYGDSERLHDEIVGSSGAFAQTIMGLYSIASHHSCVELRVVVQKKNYRRLAKIVYFVARNLPFVNRIVLMSLEPQGFAMDNWEDLWIDPMDYHAEMVDAVRAADRNSITLLFYNFQLCTLPPVIRPLAVCSITDWKVVYNPLCWSCPSRIFCGGFFASQDSPRYISKGIHPLLRI